MTTYNQPPSMQALRIRAVCAYLGLSRSSIYNKITKTSQYFDPTFPKPYKLGASAIAWDRAQLEAWTISRMQQFSK